MKFDAIALQTRAQILQCRLDPIRHVDRVGAILLGDQKLDACFAHYRRAADVGFWRLDHIGDIAQRHADAALAHQHGARQVFGRQRLSLALENDALVGGIGEASAPNAARTLSNVQNIVQTDAKTDELVGMDLDLKRSRLAAKYRNLRDARDGQQSRTNRPIRNRPQFHQRTLL